MVNSALQIIPRESSLAGGTTKQSDDEIIKRLIIVRADRFVPVNDGKLEKKDNLKCPW